MSNKFNANALTEYSKSYARRIATDFYQHHTTANGEQILSLTPITQINLFVISSLSDKWKADAEKFRSHYFDFGHTDVQEALQHFMNVVSQHISVRREHLEPLLAEATRRTIVMIFDPRAYFDEILRSQPEFMLTAASLKQITRFTKINQFIPAYLTQRLKDKPFVYANQAIGYLDEVLAQRGHELEHYDKYVGLFSEKLPMDVPALLRSHVPDSIPNAPTRSFFDTATESAVPPAPLVPAEVTPNTPVPAIPPQPVPVEAVGTSEQQAPVAPEPDFVPVVAESTDSSTGGPKFLGGNSGPEPVAPISQPSQLPTGAISQPAVAESNQLAIEGEMAHTLNDTLRETASVDLPDGQSTSVAETFHRAPIESVARSISLNQKFRFINQLFNGNTGAYNQAVEEIDALSSYGQALDLISDRYAPQYLWDMKSDEVSELIDILKRRFA